MFPVHCKLCYIIAAFFFSGMRKRGSTAKLDVYTNFKRHSDPRKFKMWERKCFLALYVRKKIRYVIWYSKYNGIFHWYQLYCMTFQQKLWTPRHLGLYLGCSSAVSYLRIYLGTLHLSFLFSKQIIMIK